MPLVSRPTDSTSQTLTHCFSRWIRRFFLTNKTKNGFCYTLYQEHIESQWCSHFNNVLFSDNKLLDLTCLPPNVIQSKEKHVWRHIFADDPIIFLFAVTLRRLWQSNSTLKGFDHAHSSHEAKTPGTTGAARALFTRAEKTLHPRSCEYKAIAVDTVSSYKHEYKVEMTHSAQKVLPRRLLCNRLQCMLDNIIKLVSLGKKVCLTLDTSRIIKNNLGTMCSYLHVWYCSSKD